MPHYVFKSCMRNIPEQYLYIARVRAIYRYCPWTEGNICILSMNWWQYLYIARELRAISVNCPSIARFFTSEKKSHSQWEARYFEAYESYLFHAFIARKSPYLYNYSYFTFFVFRVIMANLEILVMKALKGVKDIAERMVKLVNMENLVELVPLEIRDQKGVVVL